MTDFHEQAARWHARTMAGALSPADELALDAWLDADLRHRAAFTDIVAAGLALKHAKPRLPAAPRAVRARRWPAWVAGALAAPVLLALAVAAPRWLDAARSDFHTARGAALARTLEDGSTLRLDTDSAVRVRIGAGARDVELLRGALAVDVAKDASRPFHVRAGDAVVTAVGTRFVVARVDGGVDVGLLEGKVSVVARPGAAPLLLEAGDRVRIDSSGAARRDAFAASDYSWTRGVLAFDRAPLATVLAEIDRYLPERVVLAARSHANAPVTATLPAHDAHAALDAVARSEGLRVSCVAGVACVVRE